MPAKIYSTPAVVGKNPSLDDYSSGFDGIREWEKARVEFEKAVSAWAKENGQGKLAGEVVRFPVADGYASYVVFSHQPLGLIEIDHDDYQISDVTARGLTITDIKKMVEFRQRWAAIAKAQHG